MAAGGGHKDIVDLLLATDAHPGLEDLSRLAYWGNQKTSGWTALHFAARYGHKECVDRLLRGGAPAGHEDMQGKTARDYAFQFTPEHAYKNGSTGGKTGNADAGLGQAACMKALDRWSGRHEIEDDSKLSDHFTFKERVSIVKYKVKNFKLASLLPAPPDEAAEAIAAAHEAEVEAERAEVEAETAKIEAEIAAIQAGGGI